MVRPTIRRLRNRNISLSQPRNLAGRRNVQGRFHNPPRTIADDVMGCLKRLSVAEVSRRLRAARGRGRAAGVPVPQWGPRSRTFALQGTSVVRKMPSDTLSLDDWDAVDDPAFLAKISIELRRFGCLPLAQFQLAERWSDQVISEVEKHREHQDTYIFLRFDECFAKLEMKDRPELRQFPVAVVSKGSIQSVNRIAKFRGVKPGACASEGKRLCPELILIPSNGVKYSKFVDTMRVLLSNFESHCSRVQVDSIQISITVEKERKGFENGVASWIKDFIKKNVSIICDAGIGPTPDVAKLAVNMVYSPGGVHQVKNDKLSTSIFLRGIELSRYVGISFNSNVEKMLRYLKIYTPEHIWDNRVILAFICPERLYYVLMAIAMGIPPDSPFLLASEVAVATEPKSVKNLVDFAGTGDPDKLKQHCFHACQLIKKELDDANILGQTVVCIFTDVESKTTLRACRLAQHTNSFGYLHKACKNIVDEQFLENPGKRYCQVEVLVAEVERVDKSVGSTLDSLSKVVPMRTKDFVWTRNPHNQMPMSIWEFRRPFTPEMKQVFKPRRPYKIDAEASPIFRLLEMNGVFQFGAVLDRYVPETVQRKPPIICPVCKWEVGYRKIERAEARMTVHVDECLKKNVLK